MSYNEFSLLDYKKLVGYLMNCADSVCAIAQPNPLILGAYFGAFCKWIRAGMGLIMLELQDILNQNANRYNISYILC